MNKMHGESLRHIENIARISFSLSPKYLFIRVDLMMGNDNENYNCKLINGIPDSLANALASIVFPVPGGPI